MRLSLLKAGYLQAVARAEAVAAELAGGDLPEPDGSLAYRNALIAESVALEAYMDARRDLMILTVAGQETSIG